jgi:hypothetical protein
MVKSTSRAHPRNGTLKTKYGKVFDRAGSQSLSNPSRD